MGVLVDDKVNWPETLPTVFTAATAGYAVQFGTKVCRSGDKISMW